MVGLVIVCHSNKLADGLLHELRMFSKTCPIAVAGGDDNNDYGTSYTKIKNAIDEVYDEDGVCIIVDVGSSFMVAQMIIEELNDDKIVLLDCSLLENAIEIVMSSEQGKTLTQIVDDINNKKRNLN